MIYKVDKIVPMVRMYIGRNVNTEPLIRCRDPDIVPLDQIIISKINRSAIEVYQQAPSSMVISAAKDLDDDTIIWHNPVDGLYSGHLLLPDDFMRLLVFEMSGWRRPVIEALTPDSPYFEASSTCYSGARGTPQRPACLVSNSAFGLALEFHSCPSDQECIVQAKYLPIPRIDLNGGLDFAPACLDLLIDTISRLTIETISTPTAI